MDVFLIVDGCTVQKVVPRQCKFACLCLCYAVKFALLILFVFPTSHWLQMMRIPEYRKHFLLQWQFTLHLQRKWWRSFGWKCSGWIVVLFVLVVLWQNSIRHNLSLYDMFVRVKSSYSGDRRATVSYWTLSSGCTDDDDDDDAVGLMNTQSVSLSSRGTNRRFAAG